MKALAAKKINGRVVYVLDGDKFEKGDDVLIRDEDGTGTLATITSKDVLSFAVSRNGGSRG